MKVVLVDTAPQLCEAWRDVFNGLDDVSIHNEHFQPLIGTFDCFVSPANSFGLMDGA